ncbi:MAG: DedA family protein [Firmicutes bacterium]|nr:DedA family protein [Alicyclobacillaceae bacterium]MCL6496442.1 DedA family protein [Bacillota bacterium]
MVQAIQTVAEWLSRGGYGAVFLVLMAESLGIPSPSEVVLLFSGYLVWQGRFQYPWVIAVGALGSTVGAALAYQIALRGGRPLLLGPLRWLFRHPDRLDAWERYFLQRGHGVVLIGRLISGVRMVISYPAGLFGMPWRRFLAYTLLGSLGWPLLTVTAGYLAGPHVVAALHAIARLQLPALIGLGLAGAALVVLEWSRRARRQRLPES